MLLPSGSPRVALPAVAAQCDSGKCSMTSPWRSYIRCVRACYSAILVTYTAMSASASTKSIPPSNSEHNDNDVDTSSPIKDDSTLAPSDAPSVTEASQQAATQPGGGPQVVVVQQPGHHITFKEQVVGHAKEIRGSILGNQETKEYGEKILRGEATYPPKA